MKRQVCLLAILLLQAYWWTQPAGAAFTIFAALLVIAAVAKPVFGAIAFAALAPLSTIVADLCGAHGLGSDLLVRVALAIATGVLLSRRSFEGPTRIGAPVLVMSMIAIASGLAMIPAAVAPLSDGLFSSVSTLARARSSGVALPLLVAITSGVCALLGWAIEKMGRQSPRLPAQLVLAGLLGQAVSAALSVEAVLGAAIRTGDALGALPRLLVGVRLSYQTDWNAAASAFLLAGLAAFGLANGRQWSRIAVVFLIALVGAGLWITGSRVAIVLGILATIGTVGWHIIRNHQQRFVLLGVVAALVVAVGAWLTQHYPEGRNDQVGNTIRDRLVLMKAGVRMAEDAPVFGIGVDRFYESSPRYVREDERRVGVPENAHNNFIQVLAEQGVVGLFGLLWMLWTVIGSGVRAQLKRPHHAPPTPHSAPGTQPGWLLLAVTACVATWLTGHPLLVPEFTFVFFLYAGALTALAPAPSREYGKRFAWIAAVILLISVPVRAVDIRNQANLEYRGLGISIWHHDDTQRYRNAGASFALFLPANERPVEVPLRRAPGAPDPLTVTIRINARPVNRIVIAGDAWQTIQVTVPGGSSQFKQVDFTVDVPDGLGASDVLLRVGKERAR